MPDKALLVGINEYRTANPLNGCVSDVEGMAELLTGTFGFNARNVKRLTDAKATKEAITEHLERMIDGAKDGDRLVFHFSGHGSYTADDDGDEERGADELLCLADMDFKDPDTYLTDDDLRRYTQRLPAGVRLLVVLDCCHSGTGTRFAPQPGPAAPPPFVPRFIIPPAEVQSRVRARRGMNSMRAIVKVELNHVLLAGCRDDQTSADAYLDGGYHGAFTYHLCRAVREAGAGAARLDIHDRVIGALRATRFDQEPQFEGSGGVVDLFGIPLSGSRPDNRPTQPTTSLPIGPPTTGGGWIPSLLEKLVASNAPLTASERSQVLSIIDRLLAGGGAMGGERLARSGGRHLVYVHGISRHDPGYSDRWWDALREHVGDLYGDGGLNGRRREVNWSNLVNRSLAAGPAPTADLAEREQVRRQIVEAIQERVDRDAERATDRSLAGPTGTTRGAGVDRGLLDGLSGLDDFTVYMVSREMRRRILERFTDVVRPLFEAGTEFDLITHSWGTVVAYEGLRELEDAGFATPLVRTLFTVGSALSIGPVRWRLLPANQDGRKPRSVGRWVNLDAAGDAVGGSLIRHFRVDDEFLGLPPVVCRPNWFGGFDVGCAHGSYFARENVRVNRDIFARFAAGG